MFQKISGMAPAAAAFLALGATFANPKNLVLLLAAGQTIGAATSGSKVLIGGIFVLIATAPYTGAAGYAPYSVARPRTESSTALGHGSSRVIG